jgi:DNA repair exonuclease SbcCD ATPase subunit
MADNTTTYTAVIDTQVKGAEEVGDLGDKAEETAGSFVKLQLQIRQTQKDLQAAAAAGDKVKFNKLRGELDELEEGLEKVQFQAKQFDDQLASLPGPAGAAGNAIKSVDGAFKVLIANPIIAVIAAIGGALLLMKKALSSTAEGQQTLNRLSQAFSGILGPILATVEKVAVPLFNGFAFILEKVALGFQKFAKFLGISEAKIKESTLSVDEVQQKANEDEKKRQEELTKKTEEENKKRADANAKAAADKKKKQEEAAAAEKKRLEEEAKNLDAANKVLTEAYIATLEQRDQEIYKAGQAQNERLKALELAGIKDKSSVLEQGRLEIAAINKKYDDEEAKKIEEKKKKDDEDAIKAAEKDKEKIDKKRQDDLLGLDTQLQFDNLSFQQRKALIDEKERVLLSDKELTENQRTSIQKAASAERKNIDMAELDAKAEIQNAYIDLAGQFGSLLQQIAGKNKKIAIAGIIIEQAASIGRIIANTAVANAKAVAAFPVTFGQPFVTINTISAALGIASTIAGAAKSISQINSSDSGAAGGGGASLPRSSGASVSAPTVASATAPQIQGTAAATPGAQIADTISAASGKPVKAYVVSGDVSSQQALDRRTSNAATFGG